MKQKLPLSSITCLEYLQQRTVGFIDDKYEYQRQQANLSSTVEIVKKDLINGQSIKIPLEVHEVDGKFLLVDGHHRYQGAIAYCKNAKVAIELYEVPVNITLNSTEKVAIDASFKVNLNHGVGLTPTELKQLYFRNYVWSRITPTIAQIRSDTACAQGTASKILKAVKWCLEHIRQADMRGVELKSPCKLKKFMSNKMSDLGIKSDYLDGYGLPSYSLLVKALQGGDFALTDVDDPRKASIRAVAEKLSYIESQYGVEALREGLRRHKTSSHGIKISQHSKWINEPTTTSLLAMELDTLDDF